LNSDAIQRVAQALRSRLQAALVAGGVPGQVFVGPLDDIDASGAPLILFLYRIVPNPSQRNRERRVPSIDEPFVKVFRNSLPLDLYFLVTVGTTAEPGEERLLGALGLAMQSLQVDPELTGPGLEHETVRVTLEPLTTDDSSRIWALFPTANYRTSVAYLASPVWIDPPIPEATAAPVREDRLLVGVSGGEARA
jgi:Pvc16 N-terminal domain